MGQVVRTLRSLGQAQVMTGREAIGQPGSVLVVLLPVRASICLPSMKMYNWSAHLSQRSYDNPHRAAKY